MVYSRFSSAMVRSRHILLRNGLVSQQFSSSRTPSVSNNLRSTQNGIKTCSSDSKNTNPSNIQNKKFSSLTSSNIKNDEFPSLIIGANGKLQPQGTFAEAQAEVRAGGYSM